MNEDTRCGISGVNGIIPLVRVKAIAGDDNAASHDLVGVYSASSLDALRDLVDESASPNDCEYATIQKRRQ